MAISILQSANGFGRAASAPLVQLLISTIGWRETYLAQAVFMAAAVPLLAAQFRRAARYPTAAEPVDPTRRRFSAAAIPAGPCRKRFAPGILAALRGLSIHRLGSFLVSLHQLAFAVDMGFDKLYAAGVLARQLPRDRRNDLHRHPVGLHRARVVGDPGLRHSRLSVLSAPC